MTVSRVRNQLVFYVRVCLLIKLIRSVSLPGHVMFSSSRREADCTKPCLCHFLPLCCIASNIAHTLCSTNIALNPFNWMVGTWGKGFPLVCGKIQFAHPALIVASTVETIQRPSASYLAALKMQQKDRQAIRFQPISPQTPLSTERNMHWK